MRSHVGFLNEEMQCHRASEQTMLKISLSYQVEKELRLCLLASELPA